MDYAALLTSGGGGGSTGGYIAAFQTLFGGHGAGKGRSATRALQQIGFATMQELQGILRESQQQRLMYLASPSAGVFPVTFGPAKLYRQRAQAVTRLGKAYGSMGDKTKPAKPKPPKPSDAKAVAKQQTNLARIAQAESLSGVTVYAAKYGINNPLIAGSRDDPRGLRFPVVPFHGRALTYRQRFLQRRY
jgi:hypothetical protein